MGTGGVATAPPREDPVTRPGGPGYTPAVRVDTKVSTVSDDTQYPQRKRPAHTPVVDAFGRSTVVFVTVCTKNKAHVLNCDFMHDLVRAAWQEADRWLVGRYMIMPDHVHFFSAPAMWPITSVKEWAEYWKGLVSRAVKGHGPLAGTGGPGSTPVASQARAMGTDGVAAVPPGGGSVTRTGGPGSTPAVPDMPDPLWQRDCWDTQLRRGENYHAKWEYVRRNPVRAGLCRRPEDWPYQGELNVLEWRD